MRRNNWYLLGLSLLCAYLYILSLEQDNNLKRLKNHIEYYEKNNMIEDDTMNYDIPPPEEDSECIRYTKSTFYGNNKENKIRYR